MLLNQMSLALYLMIARMLADYEQVIVSVPKQILSEGVSSALPILVRERSTLTIRPV
jgi:hypothetical protein